METTKSISSDELESDWVKPSPYLCDYKMLQPQGSQRVYDAFLLLQTDPSVQVLHQYYLVSVFFIRATAESSSNSLTHIELSRLGHNEKFHYYCLRFDLLNCDTCFRGW